MGSGTLCKTNVVSTVCLQMTAFYFYLKFTQHPSVFVIGVVHKVTITTLNSICFA